MWLFQHWCIPVNLSHRHNVLRFLYDVISVNSIKSTLCVQVECADVVLFWRIQQVLKVTANALRQQVMNREGEQSVRGLFWFWVKSGLANMWKNTQDADQILTELIQVENKVLRLHIHKIHAIRNKYWPSVVSVCGHDEERILDVVPREELARNSG